MLESIKAWIGYVGVIGGAVIAAYAGIRKALKDLRAGETTNNGGSAAGPEVQRIVGGTIMETTTLLMWSESNRAVVEAAEDMKDCIKANTAAITGLPGEMMDRLESLCRSVNYNTDAVRSLLREYSETRHEIVRLRDSMERKQ